MSLEFKGEVLMKNETKRYLWDIRLAFPVFRRNEKRFFADFKSTVCEYESQFPGCSREDIIEAYGTPKEVVTSYFNNMDSENYMILMRKSHYMKIVSGVAITLMVIIFLIDATSLYLLHKEAEASMIVSEQTVIVYGDGSTEKLPEQDTEITTQK